MDASQRRATYLGRNEGRVFGIFGETVAFKVLSEQTGGAYSMFEIEVPPGGEPPPHIHHHEDECLFVLEGEFEFFADDEVSRMGSDSLAYIPKGVLHTHRNIGAAPGRLIAVHTPGGSFERFLEGVASAMMDFGKVSAVAAKHGIEIPPPSGVRVS